MIEKMVIDAFDDDITIEVNDRIHVPTRRVPEGWQWLWEPKRVGRCVRCRKHSHTRDPDGEAQHPFCYGVPEVPPLKVEPPRQRRRR